MMVEVWGSCGSTPLPAPPPSLPGWPVGVAVNPSIPGRRGKPATAKAEAAGDYGRDDDCLFVAVSRTL